MKVTLNKRLIPSDLKSPVEQRLDEHPARTGPIAITYLDDPCDEVVVAVEPGAEDSPPSADPDRIRRLLDESARELLDGHGVLNVRNLEKTDARVWVRSSIPVDTLYGLDVRFAPGGNAVPVPVDGEPQARFPGTLTCAGPNELGEIAVGLITNQPLEDENGREVYRVDLDQTSVDSLRQDPDGGGWTVRLPGFYKPIL